MSDLIKREDAIKALQKEINKGIPPFDDTMGAIRCGVRLARNIIEDLPSADRPQGEWLKFGLGRGTRILFCTNCERRIEVPLSQGDSNYDFCPNCGADMRGTEGK